MNSYDRRTVLTATSSVAFAGIAGCLGTDPDEVTGNDTEGDSNDVPTTTDSDAIDSDGLTRTDGLDGVDFTVVFVNPLLDAGATDHPLRDEGQDHLLFEVSMDTHSGDLTDLDWEDRIILRTDDADEIDDLDWVWERESDHHPKGYVRIPKTSVDGNPIISSKTDEIVLEIEMDDGAAKFEWVVGDPAGVETNGAVYAYVTNSYGGTVSVIDHADRTVVETIEVADVTSHGIAVDPDGSTVYVGDGENGTVYPIAADTFEVGDAIAVGSNAHGIDVDPTGRQLYVSGGSVDARGKVTVVDLDDHEVVGRIDTDGAGHVNFGPDGQYAYVSNVDLNQIAVVDTSEMEVLETVPVGDGPNEAVPSPDGRYVYTANVRDDSVSVVEVETWEEVDRIPAGEGTHGIDITPDGAFVWTANRATNDLTVIDTESRAVLETITAVEGANHLTISPDGSTVYATAPGTDETFVVDSRTVELIDRVDVGQEPHEIVFRSDP